MTEFRFDSVADLYEAGRPDYPEAVYDALEPLGGALVLEGGAGTGIATEPMLRRGARLIPFDVGAGVLSRLVRRLPSIPAVVADGSRLPFRDECADMICFAQAWHWLDERSRAEEAARVLRPEGRWAGWWSHARADGEPWFDHYWNLVERRTGADRRDRETDWGQDLSESGFFHISTHQRIRWIREATVDGWIADEQSKSYVAGLNELDRRYLLDAIESLVRQAFPGGEMHVAYETWIWIGVKR